MCHDQVGFIPQVVPKFFNIYKLINVIHHIDKFKKKKETYDHFNEEKTKIDKSQHIFMIKTFQKLALREYVTI